jgi:HAD superfamily hydrolase (TIGR01549 family)
VTRAYGGPVPAADDESRADSTSPSAPAPDTAVVDVDGTLVDTNYQHAVAWARAFARYDVFPPLWRIHRAIGMGGDRLVAAVAGDEVEQRCGDDLREAWTAEFDAFLPEVQVLAGAKEFLAFLRRQGLKVVLATSGKPEHVAHFLDLLDGRTLSDDVVTSADAESSKPAPDLVRSALEQVDGSAAVMVGDSTWDVRSAAELGVPTVCVRTGGFPDADLTEAGARAVYDDLPALQAAWGKLFSAPR